MVTNFIGYIVYILFTSLGVKPVLAVTLLFGVGALISFLGNRRFTFSVTSSKKQAGVRYAAVYFLGYLFNLSILLVFVDWLGLAHQIVQACAIFVVAAVLFLLSKYYVFSSSQNQGEDAS
tara:strand:+ start:19223 stop:19582 length:360 start_codon:yes stop_codon:yes gene_type:complete